MCFQLIQSISAVDKDDSEESHHFYFSLAQESTNNSRFTVKDNQGTVIHVLFRTFLMKDGCFEWSSHHQFYKNFHLYRKCCYKNTT